MTDIITLGELLIDLTQNGEDENGNGKFTAFPGGAPANVAVAASTAEHIVAVDNKPALSPYCHATCHPPSFGAATRT